MNKRDTLSIAPYFGGKSRMTHFIADQLNYDDSDIFVTPFGGMCRVLLNKPRHKVECYNDSLGHENVRSITLADVIGYIPRLTESYQRIGDALSLLRAFGAYLYEHGLTDIHLGNAFSIKVPS